MCAWLRRAAARACILLLVSSVFPGAALAQAQVLGDLDTNGVVDVRDLVRLIDHIRSSASATPMGTGLLPASLRGYADVTGDGYINQADVDMLANAILGIPIPTRPRPIVSEPAGGASEVGVTVHPRVFFPKPID